MKIGIIGSNSFIASYVIEELHLRGHHVNGLQRHWEVQNEAQAYNPDTIYIGDIKDSEAVEKVVAGSDYVINLAGILGTSETVNNPIPAVEVNIFGTLNVLQACRIWNRPFLQIAVGNHWMNNTYSITRTTAERFTLMYEKEHGLKANVVRALNAYGPRQTFASYKKIIPSFIIAALQNQPLYINGDGEQLMDMIFVSDLASFLCDVLIFPESVHNNFLMSGLPCNESSYGNVYQCGSSDSPTVKRIAETVIRLSESSSEIIYREMRKGEPMNAKVVADYQSPAYKTSLEEGLLKTIEFYRLNLDKYTK